MKTRIFTMIIIIALLAVSLSTVTLAQSKIKFEQPVLLTSAGQSADVTIAGMLFKRAMISAKTAPMAKAADLEGVKTLVVVAGFSSKGLGAAGISREQELDRVKSLLADAKAKKINILTLHLGGKSRRGNQSDDFNALASESARHLIVVKQGDEDQFFTKIAGTKNISIDLVDKIADAMTPLKKIF